MIQEMHVWLDLESPDDSVIDLYITYTGVCKALKEQKPIIHTTLLYFAQLWYADKLFIHINGKCHEITTGECDGTRRFIRKTHNIAKLIAAGDFEWFKGCDLYECSEL